MNTIIYYLFVVYYFWTLFLSPNSHLTYHCSLNLLGSTLLPSSLADAVSSLAVKSCGTWGWAGILNNLIFEQISFLLVQVWVICKYFFFFWLHTETSSNSQILELKHLNQLQFLREINLQTHCICFCRFNISYTVFLMVEFSQ